MNDNLILVTDGNGNRTSYTYDRDGHLLSETDGEGNTCTYAYSPEGWLLSETKADGSQTSYSYDDTGVLTGIDYGGEEQIIYSYTARGLLATVSGKEGDTAYQYDTEGSLIEAKLPDGKRLSYEYDEAGRRSSIIYPEGDKVSYSYDEIGRLSTVTGLDGSITAYEYDQAGRRTRTISENRTTDYRYNSLNQLVSQVTTGDTELSLSYTYDKTGKMLTKKRLENGRETVSSYSYDAAGQLISFERSDGSDNLDGSAGYQETYTYDAAGNMTTRTINGQELSMSYDGANRMSSMQSENGRITYQYDENGSLIRKESSVGVDSYTYQKNGTLSAYSGYDGYEERYTYLPEGMLSGKEKKGDELRLTQEKLLEGRTLEDKYTEEALLAHGKVGEAETTVHAAEKGFASAENDQSEEADQWIRTDYVFDMSQEIYQLLEETTEGRTTRYEYGLERIDAYLTDTSKQEYLYDGRGSVIETLWYQAGSVQSAAGNLQSKEESVQITAGSYTPYGKPLEKAGQVSQTFGYNGEQYNDATGMLCLRARWSEPAVSRFNQKNVMGGNTRNGLTLNRYLYAQNDPIRYQDPSGKISAAGLMLSLAAYAVKKVILPHAEAKIVQAAQNGNTAAQAVVRMGTAVKRTFTGQPSGKQIQEAKDKAAADSIEKAFHLEDKLDKKKMSGMNGSQRLAYVCSAARESVYASYWNRNDGYFSGCWWQDERKLREAYRMAAMEARDRGRIDLLEVNKANSRTKMEFFQELLYGQKTGLYDDETCDKMQNAYTRAGLEGKENEVTPELLEALKEDHDKNIFNGFNHWGERGGAQLVGGVLMLASAVVYSNEGTIFRRDTSKRGNETYYRTMSQEDYEQLRITGELPPTNETFISPTRSFSDNYDGVTVKFEVKAGTINFLKDIGVSNNTAQSIKDYGVLPQVRSGWNVNNAFFKGEGTQTNIGLGQGKAREIFNNNMINFERVGGNGS